MERRNRIGSFLDMPLAELQRRRRSMSLCAQCLQLGLPDYFAGRAAPTRLAECQKK